MCPNMLRRIYTLLELQETTWSNIGRLAHAIVAINFYIHPDEDRKTS